MVAPASARGDTTARGDMSMAVSAVNESRSSTFSSITPRASRDEIERRRKVMFDSEDEDTPSQPNNQNTSKVSRARHSGDNVPVMHLHSSSNAAALCMCFWHTDS